MIDVHERCILVAPKNCKYVALSYMWGDRDLVVETLKSNFETFMLPQGLDKGPKPLPRTISDAIDFVRAIGQKYLWVDALCIIQDDKDDQKHQIRNMDLVYGLASFTIVAADGADAGLVGVKSGTRKIVQDIEEVEPNLTLVVSLCGFGPQQRARSKWNTRAWTFQEALLSRRMVIFFNGEMTWECREAVWTEDLHVSPGAAIGSFAAPHYSNSMTPLLEGRLAAIRADPLANASTYTSMNFDNLTVYENAVREYTAREMKYQSDMLNAFSGLAKTLETVLASSFLQGLPQNCLDSALLWTPEQILERRSGFASWSWAGWVGKSRYISMNQNVIKPAVRYYVVDKDAGANPTLLQQKWEEGNYEPSLRPWRVVKPAVGTWHTSVFMADLTHLRASLHFCTCCVFRALQPQNARLIPSAFSGASQLPGPQDRPDGPRRRSPASQCNILVDRAVGVLRTRAERRNLVAASLTNRRVRSTQCG